MTNMEDNIREEIRASTKFNDEEELMKTLTEINNDFFYIEKEQFVRWLNGDDLIN